MPTRAYFAARLDAKTIDSQNSRSTICKPNQHGPTTKHATAHDETDHGRPMMTLAAIVHAPANIIFYKPRQY